MHQKRKALVTGGARGIGAAIAQELSQRGFEVVTPLRADLDLSQTTSIEKFLKDSAMDFDVLINNAGINVLKSVVELDGQTWNEMMQVNLSAPLRLIQAVTPHMRKNKWGRILNVSSIFSLVTKENRAAYSMTKSGLNALTRSAAVELGSHGILVNSLCPGYVDTELTRKNNSPAEIEKIEESIPLRRMAKTEELARVAAFLCSEENSYLTGQTVVVDGGFTCK
jgi:NAD(P)-dependent dehydrogenase (short-subunit alcohol dehydrogenase family)